MIALEIIIDKELINSFLLIIKKVEPSNQIDNSLLI